ncbi:hypothetical protein TSAR_010502 [Trichomalopsis sarcophagae]|uniref:NADH dehydrogenase subunit 1 n=1 Tax=Trichomalopsis sarcophagae TaxID=543379 RepID=A0A232FJ86_9HYME|nr:hypothetical protein TSAR_010502 [Trichomalopsis sarcophagae]
MHIYFWILNLEKTVIFYFLNYFVWPYFLIFKTHYFAFFFLIIPLLQTIRLKFI